MCYQHNCFPRHKAGALPYSKRRNNYEKLISWNVNGLRACVGKGFMDFFNEVDADVFCIQESKLQEGQIDLDLPGYHQ